MFLCITWLFNQREAASRCIASAISCVGGLHCICFSNTRRFCADVKWSANNESICQPYLWSSSQNLTLWQDRNCLEDCLVFSPAALEPYESAVLTQQRSKGCGWRRYRHCSASTAFPNLKKWAKNTLKSSFHDQDAAPWRGIMCWIITSHFCRDKAREGFGSVLHEPNLTSTNQHVPSCMSAVATPAGYSQAHLAEQLNQRGDLTWLEASCNADRYRNSDPRMTWGEFHRLFAITWVFLSTCMWIWQQVLWFETHGNPLTTLWLVTSQLVA